MSKLFSIKTNGRRLAPLLIIFLPVFVYSQWEELTSLNLDDTPLKLVTSKDQDSVVAVILWDSVFLSTDYGNNWNLLHSDTNAGYTDLFIAKENITLSKWDTLFNTSNFGDTWTYINLPSFVVTEFSMINNNILINTPYYTIYRTNDNGEHWYTVNKYDIEDYDWECWESGSPHCRSIQTYGNFLGINGNNIFYNLEQVEYGEGQVHSTNNKGLHKSWNFGEDWIPLNIFGVRCIDFFYPRIFVSTTDGIFRSDDYGNNWDRILPETFLIFTVLQNNIVGLTLNNIFISNDFGDTWLKYDKELDYSESSKFSINDTYVFVSIGNKIYRRKLIDFPLGINSYTKSVTPLIYPNPTSDIIYINNQDIFSIEIVDLYGKSVIRINEAKEYINLTSLESGMYLMYLKLNYDKFHVLKIIKN